MSNLVPDLPGAAICLAGALAQVSLGRGLRLHRTVNLLLGVLFAFLFFVVRENLFSPFLPWLKTTGLKMTGATEFLAGILLCWYLFLIATWALFSVRAKVPAFRSDRRQFLKASTMAVCASPGILLGTGFITRKEVHVKEVDISFPNLPADLAGKRLLLLSDIHMGAFFSARDLERVVDASNQLRADMAFVTGDLITTADDPLDQCLAELRRLRAASGVWGCMGNHELYAKAQAYTKRKGKEIGIDFLRQEAREVTFGRTRLNLVGVDYQWPGLPYLYDVEPLVSPGAFNLLLSHNPDVFPTAAQKGFDLTLSGHTHGGQINLEILGTNLNAVDFITPYTKGLYRMPNSSIYVTSGLGTIGIPVRIGAPAEITLIRLKQS